MDRLDLKESFHKTIKIIQMHKGFGRPRVFHALIVIFAEFFAWGLLFTPTITALDETFPGQTLVMNGLILGIKGCLSFLMSPPIGYLSDVLGRKPFLLLTVLFTCLPIPIMFISYWWFFIMIAISGLFSVTFSVVFAYVADLTTGTKRSSAYGKVSATFAASLIISPALGAHLRRTYGVNLVIFLATLVAVLDVLFVLFLMPESLPEKLRQPQLSMWEQSGPIHMIRKIGRDFMIWTLCLVVFLSYLPESGQYSCFFVYLKSIVGFSEEQVALFVAFIGTLSVLAQTFLMNYLIDRYGGKTTILAGLLLQALQLFLLGFFKGAWMMWISGILASISSITYPAISSYISTYADADKQGLVQGFITGVRSLCTGIGPAMFGLLFHMFDVNMNESRMDPTSSLGHQGPLKQYISNTDTHAHPPSFHSSSFLGRLIIGPPFLFSAVLVLLAAIATTFIPDTILPYRRNSTKSTSQPSYYRYTTVSEGGGLESCTPGTSSSNGNGMNSHSTHCEFLDDLED